MERDFSSFGRGRGRGIPKKSEMSKKGNVGRGRGRGYGPDVSDDDDDISHSQWDYSGGGIITGTGATGKDEEWEAFGQINLSKRAEKCDLAADGGFGESHSGAVTVQTVITVENRGQHATGDEGWEVFDLERAHKYDSDAAAVSYSVVPNAKKTAQVTQDKVMASETIQSWGEEGLKIENYFGWDYSGGSDTRATLSIISAVAGPSKAFKGDRRPVNKCPVFDGIKKEPILINKQEFPGRIKKAFDFNTASFGEKARAAKILFGVAENRPQDTDKELLKITRRTNLGMTETFPDGYELSVRNWCTNLTDIQPLSDLPALKNAMVIYVDNEDDFVKQMENTRIKEEEVLATDFEFHKETSYDGFIAVSSLSSTTATFVIDCLYSNREAAQRILKGLLHSTKVMKVFCGFENDIFRMQKDWGCYVIGAVDIQNMFIEWKRLDYQNCLKICTNAISIKLKKKSKNKLTDGAVETYLNNLTQPGLEFLLDVFVEHDGSIKNKLATLADWRTRPLAPELVEYSASDSYQTLRIFYKLYEKIGMAGLKKAILLGLPKLLKTSKLPKVKLAAAIEPGDEIAANIIKWRDFVSKHNDYTPEALLSSALIVEMSKAVRKLPIIDVQTVSVLLDKFKVPELAKKSVKLLTAYLHPDPSLLNEMMKIVCHNCNEKGHTAAHCAMDENPETKRAFRNRLENEEFNIKQAARRVQKYCEKRNLDPATAVMPWSQHK